MTPHQKAAHELINEYYFMLPNNGSLNTGINSCESRYKEAVDCALLSVKQLILTLLKTEMVWLIIKCIMN